MSAYYEPGDYCCRVVEQGFTESKTKKPMVVFRVRVEQFLIDADRQTEETQPLSERYERTVRLVINTENEKSMDFLLKKLRYAGFEGESFIDLDLVGADVRCTCKHGTYEGDSTEDWDFMLPPKDDAGPLDSDPALIRKIDTLFGRKLKQEAKKEKAEQREEAQAEAVPAGVPQDEIPF